MRKLLYPTEIRSRALFRQAFGKVKSRMLADIDAILADPAKRSSIMPPCHNYATHEEVRLGAYLSWWRDHGHEPDGRNEAEWREFLNYNGFFPICPEAMKIRDIMERYE